MRTVATLFCLFMASQIFAQQQPQPAAEALAKDTKSLQERLFVLKTKSQTFKDYKVIKETILDGMFVVINDSMKASKKKFVQAKASITKLDSSLVSIKLQLKQKQESMNEVEHASTHITVLGIDFKKGVFLTIMTIGLAALILFIGVLSARLKVLHKSYREKADTVDELHTEYEDFKRKAMDKQTKLSRELQDERNKLQSMRSI